MSRGIFLVALRNKNQEVEERIKQRYQNNHYKLSDNVFLISTDTITRNLAIEIGIRDDDYIESGVAFRLEVIIRWTLYTFFVGVACKGRNLRRCAMPTNGVDLPEPEHPTPSEREHTDRRLTKLEVDAAHTVSEAYLEKAIGDMREGITQAVGRMETTIAKEVGDMKTTIAKEVANARTWALISALGLIAAVAVIVSKIIEALNNGT